MNFRLTLQTLFGYSLSVALEKLAVDTQNCIGVFPLDLHGVHGTNIYLEFVNGVHGPAQREVSRDISGWGLEYFSLGAILDVTKPSFFVEVGSWKGLSAITIAHWMKARRPCNLLVCVDTWLGTTVAWEQPDKFGNTLHRNAGYPSVFYQFLYNVMDAGMDDVIIPLPMPSTMGAIYFEHKRARPDAVFIDGCHDYPCVYSDIISWFAVVKSNGALFGDDVSRASVSAAVVDAARYLQASFCIVGRYWLMSANSSVISRTLALARRKAEIASWFDPDRG